MIEYALLSRNVLNPNLYRKIRDERLVMKANKDPRQAPRKIVLNGTFGASKDKYNGLYDPRQANSLCIMCQLFLVDLIEKLECISVLVQSNTDGILIKVQSEEDVKLVEQIIHEWEKRTRFKMEIDRYTKVFQKDVNNYIIVPDGELYDLKGKPRWKSKGAWVKKQSVLDYELPIVNKAIINYFIFGKSVKDTILSADKLIEFQMISKIGQTYEYCVKEDLTKGTMRAIIDGEMKMLNCEVMNNRVYRMFASKDKKDGHFYKKHKNKNSLDLVPNSPERCRILNTDITELGIPNWLDLQFYIDLANKRISEFC